MIKALYIKPAKGEPAISVNSAEFVADCGIRGDCHFPSKERGVCFVNEEISSFLEKAKTEYPCTAKFSPNIVFSGNRHYRVNETVKVGSAELMITEVGRKCHGICPFADCPLIEGAVFARVTADGRTEVGDTENYA